MAAVHPPGWTAVAVSDGVRRPVRPRTAIATVVLAASLVAPAAQGALLSQGGVRMGADALWSRGVLGEGQEVAIVDEGFAGLDRSIALGELPPRDRLEIRLFDELGGEAGLTEFGVPTQHGVRMAELVHDLAPRARLVLVGYRTPDQFARAAAWVAAKTRGLLINFEVRDPDAVRREGAALDRGRFDRVVEEARRVQGW